MHDAFTLRPTPDTPPTLDVILEKFKQNQSDMENWKELLKRIKESKQSFSDGAVADDINIRVNIGMTTDLHKDEYRKAYVEYMGLTFYWQSKQKSEFAWHYYAQAQYYLGIYNSWEYAIDHLIKKDLDRQNRAKGGKSKNQKTTKLLMDALVKLIIEKKPINGWKTKKTLIDHAIPIIGEIIQKNGPDGFPLYENLERTIYSWLRNDSEAHAAYINNAAPNNKDVYP